MDLQSFTEGGLNFHEKVELHNLYLNGSLKKFTHSLKLFVNKIKCPSLKQHCLHLLPSKEGIDSKIITLQFLFSYYESCQARCWTDQTCFEMKSLIIV